MADAPYFLVIEARFYDDIADELVNGAVKAIETAGATYSRISVPGALEIPTTIRMAIRSMDLPGGRRRYDGFVALGCVIRGETSHYDHVCQEAMHGISQLGITYSVAIGNGVLTCENRDQAWQRAAVDLGDKGGTAARAAMRMIEVKRDLLPGR